ncbi:MAG: dihydrolipoamide acetyltransferase family protein [Bacillota bacterium]|nr:dihydrolipoamide acetyltransferase family protein [Bacillota bacterium]
MDVKLHDIGEGMTEAEITFLFVKPGDEVKADQPLLEVQTDKMTAEIPAPAAGIVKEILVKSGETVKVGTKLIKMDVFSLKESNHSLSYESITNTKTIENLQQNTLQERPQSSAGRRILASPYTRKIARENSINIEWVVGTGPAGRITDADVHSFIDGQGSGKTLTQEEIFSKGNEEVQISTMEHVHMASGNTIPFRGRRKQIAKKMHQSVYTIPHCTHFEEVDVTELIQFRSELKQDNENVSATAFFLKALSVCLFEFPIFNAKLDEENEVIHILAEHHLGIAVDTEDGLIVPVVKNVQEKSLKTIHNEMKELTQKALRNELNMQDISGGTFTISNVGPLGGSIGATPIIQYPQVALVSFHKTKKMPVVLDDDQIAIRSIMNLSMSFDHRVVDGATAVKFTNRFSQYIKNPKKLLLELV